MSPKCISLLPPLHPSFGDKIIQSGSSSCELLSRSNSYFLLLTTYFLPNQRSNWTWICTQEPNQTKLTQFKEGQLAQTQIQFLYVLNCRLWEIWHFKNPRNAQNTLSLFRFPFTRKSAYVIGAQPRMMLKIVKKMWWSVSQ